MRKIGWFLRVEARALIPERLARNEPAASAWLIPLVDELFRVQRFMEAQELGSSVFGKHDLRRLPKVAPPVQPFVTVGAEH